MWFEQDDEHFVGPAVSIFPMGDGPDHDAFVCCDVPDCGIVWGVHGTGDFDQCLRAEGWIYDEGKHMCPAHGGTNGT